MPEKEILIALRTAGYKGTITQTPEGTAVDTSQSSSSSDDPTHEKVKTAVLSTSDQPLSQTVFQIEGMTCEGCADEVSEAIGSVPGVTDVKVDFRLGRTTVRSPACCTLPTDAILSAVKKAGFDGVLIKNEKGSQPERKTSN